MIDIKKVHNFLRNRETLRIREKQKKREQMLKRLRDVLSDLSGDYEYATVWLYGSWNKGCEHKFSDIDLALRGKMDFLKLMGLRAELEKELQTETDIRILEELPFKDIILKQGQVVYDRENQTA